MPPNFWRGFAEEGGQALKIGLLPGLEGMVVALGAINPHAEERARHAGRHFFFVDVEILSSGLSVTDKKLIAGSLVPGPGRNQLGTIAS